MSAALVLLSGGQDSTTSLFWARMFFDEVVAVSISYGQRHRSELRAAKAIADFAGLGTHHYVLPLAVLQSIGDSALVDETKPIEGSGGYADAQMTHGLPTSFVPGRNLLMLSAAAALAVKLNISDIVTGVCQTDYSGYPDCRREFIDSLEATLTLAMPSSAGPFRIHTPLMHMSKGETVRLAHRLPGCWEALGLSVTCYEGQRPGCGECPACVLRAAGFAEAGLEDPAEKK